VLAIHFFSSWGFLVHKTIHQLAIYELPKPLSVFYYKNMKLLVDSAGRPDLRRNRDSMEASRHFIDLEAFGDSAAWKMPFKWEEAVIRYSKDTLLEYGYVPYHIITMKNKLTDAFKSKNRDSILFYSIDIAHYIGDANVPLHTSLNYDGQLTNQKGLHSLWESLVPESEIQQYILHSGHKARYLSNPEQEIWNCIRRAHLLLPDVFGKEIEVSKSFTEKTKYKIQTRRGREVKTYSDEFVKAYAGQLGNTVNEQLKHSTNMIADFWYTAWVDAGKPDPTTFQTIAKTDKKSLKKEKKAWQKNELLSSGLLLSKKQPAE
jgi:hypothetical protein